MFKGAGSLINTPKKQEHNRRKWLSSCRYKILQPTDRKLRRKNLNGTEWANTKNAEHTRPK